MESLHGHFEKQGLIPVQYSVNKIIQLYEMILVRHGLMVVGMPYGGKTNSLRLLAAALTELAEKGELNIWL